MTNPHTKEDRKVLCVNTVTSNIYSVPDGYCLDKLAEECEA